MTIGSVEFFNLSSTEPDTSAVELACKNCKARQRCAPNPPGYVVKANGKTIIEVLGILTGTDECELPLTT